MKSKFLEIFYPYCIERLEDGRYVILNRNYKPLGVMTSERIDYGPYAVSLKITPSVASKISWKGDADITRIYLYQSRHTVCESYEWKAYTERLKVLSSRVVEGKTDLEEAMLGEEIATPQIPT
ncbi:hypothetical protein [Adonisia turfae]